VQDLGLALLFDLDGVIVDSNPVHVLVWKEYLAKHGIDPGGTLPGLMYGRRNDEIVRDLFGSHLSAAEVQRHGAEKEALYRKVMRDQLGQRLVPGIRDFLQRHRRVPKALVTNAEPANAEFILNESGLREYFAVVVDGHQVERPKPAPDIYLLAAHLLGKEPADCIVFEDSETGVRAAKAAGTRVVAVATTESSFPEAEVVIRDFMDPVLAGWMERQLTAT